MIPGGWILVGNYTVKDLSFLKSWYTGRTLENLQLAITGRYILDVSQYELLKRATNFKEVRIFCTKPSHNRTIHVVLNGSVVVQYVTQRDTGSLKYCKKIQFLPDDTSLLSTITDCKDITAKSSKNIYDQFICGDSQYFVQLTSDFACDDKGTHNYLGTWLYYVR